MGLAIRADAEEIKDFLQDFLKVTVPIANMRARIDDPNIITTIIHGLGYCQLKIRENEKSIKVEALFPRGEKMEKLRPILNQALREVVVRFPNADDWRVWAQFWNPKGPEKNRYDGGESEVRKWVSAYADGMVELVPPDQPGGLWTGQSTIGRMLRRLT